MKKINTNWIGFGILVCAWTFSAVRYAGISTNLRAEESESDGSKRVIRVLHWQLEPGYRKGIDHAIDQYNALPHVQAANVEVRQMAVTERVYAQFINVHLISGTAPDICVSGMSRLLGQGAANARYFDAISTYVKEPNPYNSEEYLPENLDPELKSFLSSSAWSETFSDGMLGGWDDQLQDYFSVPVSSWGALRVFSNQEMVLEIKEFARKAMAEGSAPWLKNLLEEDKLLTVDDAFRSWLASDEMPNSLGRFFFICSAVEPYGESIGHDNLAAISASNYGAGLLDWLFRVALTAKMAPIIDVNHNGINDGWEILGGWQSGTWDFNNPVLKNGFFDANRFIARFYPVGYLGLDREQAVRRFLNGNAVFIGSGGWDASTMFRGAEGSFTVKVLGPQPSVEGERWYPYSAGVQNEAETRMGVPMSIYKQSRNKEWALDFLRYLSSFPVNEEMNRIAGWVPVVVGAIPEEHMLPFLPYTQGIKPSNGLSLNHIPPPVRSAYEQQFPLYQSGDISYDEFIAALASAFTHERNGIDRMWWNDFVSGQDRARSTDRAMVLVRLQAEEAGWNETLLNKQSNLMESSLQGHDGFGSPYRFHTLFPKRDFPEY